MSPGKKLYGSRLKNIILKRIYWLPLLLLVIWVLFPIVWGFSASFKSYSEVYEIPPSIIPDDFSFRAYNAVVESRNFFRYVFNSSFLAVTSTSLAVFISFLGAYGFARYKFRFSSILLLFILIPRIIPRSSLIIPLFQMMSFLDLLDSFLALILTYTATAIPMNIMVLTGFFRNIPMALEESAEIDGAGFWRRLWHIVIPMSLPAVITITVISMREAWNEFPFALALMTSATKRTLPCQLFMLRDSLGIEDWPIVLAFTMATIIPILVFYLIFQKKVTSGLIKGALK